MQQGNLLNNLLNLNTAATSNKPVAKSHPVNSSSDNQQDFQQLMAQTRSEVAAEKPVPKPRATATSRQPSTENDKRLDARSTPAQQPKPAVKPEQSRAQSTSKDSHTEAAANTKLPTETHEQVPVEEDSAEHVATSTPELVVTDVVTSLGENPVSGELVNQEGVLLVDGAVSSMEMSTGLMFDGQTPEGQTGDDQIGDDPIDVTTNEGALLSLLPDTSGQLTTQVAEDSQGLALTGVSTPLIGLAGEEGDTEQADDAETLELLPSGLTKGSPKLSDSSTLQTLQGARANPLMADLSTVKFTAADTLPQTDVLVEDSESSGIDLDSGWDMSSGFTTKTNLLKTAENLLAPLEKSLAADVTKPAAPTVTSLVDAFGRPQENPLGSTRSFTAQIALPQTMGHPQWNQAVGERVLWMAAQNLTAADIRLDPPELGSMQVKVSIQQDQASVSFISANPLVREALDQQATRLREMFAEQGLNLVHVDVSDRHAKQRESADEQGSGARGGKQDEEDGLQILGQSQPMNVRLVDHYA